MCTLLEIELVPKTSWYSNLRSILTESQWDKVRKQVYANAGNCCEICNGKGPKWPVECHEKWEYDEDNLIQKLTGLIALCPSCHEVKHIGLAEIKGNAARAKKHLAKVNKWDMAQTEAHISEAFFIWNDRNKHDWELDLDWLAKEFIGEDNDI
jgi:hypothetical protein